MLSFSSLTDLGRASLPRTFGTFVMGEHDKENLPKEKSRIFPSHSPAVNRRTSCSKHTFKRASVTATKSFPSGDSSCQEGARRGPGGRRGAREPHQVQGEAVRGRGRGCGRGFHSVRVPRTSTAPRFVQRVQSSVFL